MDNLSGGILLAEVRCIWCHFEDGFRHCLHPLFRLDLQGFTTATDVLAHFVLCRPICAPENSLRTRLARSMATGSVSRWVLAAGHCLPELEYHSHVCSGGSIDHCRGTTVSMEMGMSRYQGQSHLSHLYLSAWQSDAFIHVARGLTTHDR